MFSNWQNVTPFGIRSADDFVLDTGRGKSFNKADLLASARNKVAVYEHQEDTNQTVRVWGDTAVVTALLWIKGTRGERKLWFSDTYVRTQGRLEVRVRPSLAAAAVAHEEGGARELRGGVVE